MGTPVRVADAAVAVSADLKQYDADLRKAEGTGTASSNRLASAVRRDFGGAQKVIAGSAAAIFAIALKGGHEVKDVMEDYRAATGATEEEAAVAQKTLIGLYKTNTDGLETLGKVLAVVHNGMGLVGDDAKNASQLILDFSHATGTDAVQAATELDRVTKLYNLDVTQQRDLLDQLVVSSQKYGGSADARLQNLIALGPALKAANLGTADGIGLLNLFAKAGVDADGAAKALTKSLTKIKSPEELTALIADIAKTADPLERAQKASALFGAKAGPALAAALAEGTGSLNDFTPAVVDAAGATEKAADIVENKFTNKLKTLFHSLTGDISGELANFSNLAQGIGAVVGALTALEIVSLEGLSAAKIKDAAASALSAVATTAQAAAYVLLRPSLWGTALGVTALTVAQAAYTVVAWLATAATTALGVAVNFLLSPLGLIILAVGALFIAWNTNFLGIRDIVGAVVGFIVDHLGFLFPILDAVGKAVGAVFGFIGDVIGNVSSAVDHALNDANRAADAAATETTRIVSDHLRSEHDDWYDATSHAATGIVEAIADRKDDAAAAAHDVSQAGVDVLKAERGLWAEAARRAATSVGQEIRHEGPDVHRAMGELMLKGAQGIRDKRSAIDSALDQLKTDIKNRMSRTAEIGKLTGDLLGKLLAKHLHDSDPLVKKQAEGTRDLIEARMLELGAKTGAAGKKAQEELEKGLHSKDPDIKAQAERTKSILDAGLKKQAAKSPGDVIGDQLNSDLGRKGTPLGKTAYQLGRTIASNIIAGVKGAAAPGSQVSEPTTGVVKPGGSFDVGTTYVPHDMLAQIHKGEIIIPPAESDFIRKLGGLGGPLVGELNVDARGHPDAAGVGRAVKQAVSDVMADVLRDESIRGYTGVTP